METLIRHPRCTFDQTLLRNTAGKPKNGESGGSNGALKANDNVDALMQTVGLQLKTGTTHEQQIASKREECTATNKSRIHVKHGIATNQCGDAL
jgi:hypothetical protein